MKPGPQLSRQQRAEQAAAKVEAAQQILAERLAALRSGEDWMEFLRFQAQLHQYSPNNVMLIYFQHAAAFAQGRVATAEPTYVAGFHTWRSLGRTVDRGQRGYAVLAPVIGVQRLAVDRSGAAGIIGSDNALGGDEAETRRRVLRGFRIEHVFEAGQTSGRPLPEPVRPRLLAGVAPAGLGEAITALIEGRGFELGVAASAAEIGGANGITDWVSRRVTVRTDMDDAARVKTLIHEAAHVLLHEQSPGRYLDRGLKEVEAESVAYLVASVHGMATDDYSFPYVATWAGEDLAGALRATQTRVARASKLIIEASPVPHHDGGRLPATALRAIPAAPAAGPEAPTFQSLDVGLR